MRILVSSPVMNAFVRALVTGLTQRGLLDRFHTTIAFGRRKIAVPPRLVAAHPVREGLRLVAQRAGLNWATSHGAGLLNFDRVVEHFDRAVSKDVGAQDAVYGYEDAVLQTFRASKQRGIPCVYELPIAYFETVQRLCREEALRYPEWEPTLLATRDSPAKLECKRQEMSMADLVICPSQFVADSLPPGKHKVVAQFGSPEVRPIRRRRQGRLRVLFVGMLSQRKGLADLFSAVRLVRRLDIEWVVLGSRLMPLEFYRRHCPEFVYERPRPQEGVFSLMDQCDVLALPSIVEGRALVQHEAMACGLPIVVTPNAGAADLVEPEKTGFLVPIRSPQIIAETISRLADDNDLLEYMSEQACRKAAEYTWTRYTNQIIQAIESRVIASRSVG